MIPVVKIKSITGSYPESIQAIFKQGSYHTIGECGAITIIRIIAFELAFPFS
ncbi:hypothetical protein ES705_48420 [subsurface metagenome]